MSERHFRGSGRASVAMRVRYRTDTALEHGARTADLSVRGAFIQTRHPPPIGTPVVLLLESPTAWEPLALGCDVRWTNDGHADGKRGFGVRFESLRPSEVTALHELIAASAYDDIS